MARSEGGHAARTERLDGGQLLDDRVALGHAHHAERKRDGDHDRQALGDGRHAEAAAATDTHCVALCALCATTEERGVSSEA